MMKIRHSAVLKALLAVMTALAVSAPFLLTDYEGSAEFETAVKV
ncbi:hypothetical protein [Planobispora takensis]|nr:hypothetical protein [Planobispora takensis]